MTTLGTVTPLAAPGSERPLPTPDRALDLALDRLDRELSEERLRWALPEYGRADLYTHAGAAQVIYLDGAGDPQAEAVRRVERAAALFVLLDRRLEERYPATRGATPRARYLALPRRTRTEKMVAQVYRLLKILHEAVTERPAHVVAGGGKISVSVSCGVAHAVSLTPLGLTLFETFVACHLTAERAPFSEAYLEALLSQYYADAADEVRRFFDEDGVLLVFRPPPPFDRHRRLRCGNPRTRVEGADLVVEIGEYHQARGRAIDFYALVHGALHIVPSEALRDGRLPLAELPRWRARGDHARILLEHATGPDSGPMA